LFAVAVFCRAVGRQDSMLRLLRELIPVSVLTLLVSEFVLYGSCFVLSSFIILEVDPTVFLLYDGGLGRIIVAVLSILLGLYFHDLYSQFLVKSRILLLLQGCQVIGIAFLIQALLSYGSADWMLPRWLMMLGSGLTLVAMLAWRVTYSSIVLRAMGEARVLFLGDNSLVREMGREIAEWPELGLKVVGYLDDGLSPDGDWQDAMRLGSVEHLREVVAQVKPDRIVVGMNERRQRLPVSDLLDIRLSGVRIEEAATTFEGVCKRIALKDLRPGQFIFSADLGPRPGSILMRSAYSSFLALAGTIATLPLMALVAVAIKLTSAGPVLFRQTRVGLHGRPFTLYKFRSMSQDAEAATGAVWATPDDPRVTPLGRWLRRLRVDELPQFFNVLRGEMVIVGPRPERPEFVSTLVEQVPYYQQRHSVKPGITGWAQINHKYGGTLEDTVKKLEYDLYYIKNMSLALDIFIIFHTLKTMLLSRGAQ
jgi:sugar transferase (PEP-CTERM system associated)